MRVTDELPAPIKENDGCPACPILGVIIMSLSELDPFFNSSYTAWNKKLYNPQDPLSTEVISLALIKNERTSLAFTFTAEEQPFHPTDHLYL